MKKFFNNYVFVIIGILITAAFLFMLIDMLMGRRIVVGAYATMHNYTAGRVTVDTDSAGHSTISTTAPTYSILTLSDFGDRWVNVSPEEYIAITNRQQVQLRGTIGRWSQHLYAPTIER